MEQQFAKKLSGVRLRRNTTNDPMATSSRPSTLIGDSGPALSTAKMSATFGNKLIDSEQRPDHRDANTHESVLISRILRGLRYYLHALDLNPLLLAQALKLTGAYVPVKWYFNLGDEDITDYFGLLLNFGVAYLLIKDGYIGWRFLLLGESFLALLAYLLTELE